MGTLSRWADRVAPEATIPALRDATNDRDSTMAHRRVAALSSCNQRARDRRSDSRPGHFTRCDAEAPGDFTRRRFGAPGWPRAKAEPTTRRAIRGEDAGATTRPTSV